MSFGLEHLDVEFDRRQTDALQCATDVARHALRASAVFLIVFDDAASVLLCGSGDMDALEAACAAGNAALTSGGLVHRDEGACAWLAMPIRLAARHGALCVAADAPRAFDENDDATAAAIASLVETLEDQLELPVQSLVDLSGFLLRQAESCVVPADTLLAAADSLDAVATRLRELAAPPRGVASAPRGVAPPQPGAARILLADDLDLNRRLIADMLSLDGHRVDCVTDGAAAVRAVTAERYDLVLMDMIMPDMDGLAATRAIRALPGPARDVPIVALTANTLREQLDSCLAAGMDATLTKPMSLDALNAAVAQWTRGRHAA